MFVRWQNTASDFFLIFNGVRQGSLLSPYLFRFHIRNLIDRITKPIVLAVTIFWHKINLNEFISLTKNTQSVKQERRGTTTACTYRCPK